MGLVLAFQTSPRPATSSRSTDRRRVEPSRGADILFFTGVRYERHAAPAPAAGTTSGSANGPALPAS